MKLSEGIKLTKDLINQAMNMEGLTFGFEAEFYFSGDINKIYTNYMMKGMEEPKNESEEFYSITLQNTRWHDVIRFFSPAQSTEWGLEDNTELMVLALKQTYQDTYGEDGTSLSEMWNDLVYEYDVVSLMIKLKIFPDNGFMEIDQDKNSAVKKIAGSGNMEYAHKLQSLNTFRVRTIMVDDEDYEFKVGGMEERNLEILFDLMAQVWTAYLGEPVGYTIADDKKKMKDATRDYSNWALTVDSSLQSQSQPHERVMIAFELISPVMSGTKGYKSLQKVLGALDDPSVMGLKDVYTVTDHSTGFHLNIGFKDREIDYLKVLVLMGDEHILEQFGRLSNTFTKSSMGQLKQMTSLRAANDLPSIIRNIEGQMKIDASDMQKVIKELQTLVPQAHNGRNFSVNLEKLPAGYIEFRSIGNGDYHKRRDEILAIARNLIVMIMIATDPSANRKEYYKSLMKILVNAAQYAQQYADMNSENNPILNDISRTN